MARAKNPKIEASEQTNAKIRRYRAKNCQNRALFGLVKVSNKNPHTPETTSRIIEIPMCIATRFMIQLY